MREPAIWLGLFFLFLALLFSGLNIAEKGIAGIMALPCRQKVFSVRFDSEKGGGVTLTFAGWRVYIKANDILNFIDRGGEATG